MNENSFSEPLETFRGKGTFLYFFLGFNFVLLFSHSGASLIAQLVKNLPAMQETPVQFLGWEDPLEEDIATHSSIHAWVSHGQRSLAGYSPWSCKKSDTTEQLSLHFASR